MMSLRFDPSDLTVPITPVAEAAPLEISDLQNIALSDAAKYGLSTLMTGRMMKTINRESLWDVSTTSSTGDVGIVQINLRSWGISTSTADDPYYSLDFIAKEFSEGHQNYWVAYKDLFEK